jgi:chromosome segregation ATPase
MHKLIAVLVILGASGLLGWGTIEHFAAAGVAKVGEVIESLKPIEVLVEEAIKEVEEIDEEHAERAEKIAKLNQDLDAVKARATADRAEVEVLHRHETNLKMLLAQGKETYALGGRPQARAEIEAKLANVRGECAQKEAEATRRSRRIDRISQEIEEATAHLNALHGRKQELLEEVRHLEARLVEAELADEVHELNSETSAFARGGQSDAARKIASIRKRVERAERRAGSTAAASEATTLTPAEIADLNRLFPKNPSE